MTTGRCRELGEFVDDREIGLDVAQLLVQPHADVAVMDDRIALGVEGDEVDRRAVVDDVLQELAQEGLRLLVGEGAAGVRAADAGASAGRASPPRPLTSYIAQNSGIVPVQ